MSHFVFRLTALLRLRESQRDALRAEVATALVQCRRSLATVERIERELVEARRGATPCGGSLDVPRLLAAHRFESLLRARLASARRQSAADAADLARRQDALVEADRELRIVVRLREAQLARHRAAELSRETRELDEIGARTVAGKAGP